MKKIVLSFALCSIAWLSNAQEATHLHDGVAVSHDIAKPTEDALGLKETEFDFGKIPQGKPVTHIFEVSNTGKMPFKLDNVQASCGCTTPQWDKEKTINPGTASVITVGYNAASEGPFTKSITVTYNGTQSKVIQIKGEVWKTPSNGAPINTGLNDLLN